MSPTVPASAPAEEFFNAARQGDLSKLETLFAADATLLAARNHLGQSALMLAKYNRQPAVAEWILAKRPDLTLHEACAAGVSSTVREIIGAQGSKFVCREKVWKYSKSILLKLGDLFRICFKRLHSSSFQLVL